MRSHHSDIQSIASKTLQVRDRVTRDFPSASKPQACIVTNDTITVVSGFEDEVDEWAALNKYNMLIEF